MGTDQTAARPSSPAALSRHSIAAALRMSVSEFNRDNLTVWAAALTYYGMLSLFPALLVLAAVLGLLRQSVTQDLLLALAPILPAPVYDILDSALSDVHHQGRAGLAALVGLLLGVWSASGYIGVFMQASNAIYDVPEGRPIWRKLPIRLAITVATGVLLVASVLIVVVSGRLADRLGQAIGLSDTTLAIWNVVKWPMLAVLVGLMFALLYWAAPNVRHGGFRWATLGGLVAVLLWVSISVLFGLYVTHFASYGKTYGALGGVIAFLVWMWLSNLAILYGAELNAELERQRAIAAGMPEGQEPYMRIRDTTKAAPGASG